MIVFSKKKKSGRFECRILEKTDPTHVTCNNAHNDEKKEEEEEKNTQLNTDDDDDDARRFRPPGSNYLPPNRVRRVCLDRHFFLALSRSVRYMG